MVSADEVLLSILDMKADSAGTPVVFYEGASVAVYMNDEDEHGNTDNLIADGQAIRNKSGCWPNVPWLLRIDSRGIRHQSDEPNA